MLCEGQIQGSVHMGLGYALSEDFPADADGRPTHLTLRSLGILRPKDVPPIEPILVEEPQPRAPYGIKGMGEIGLVPTAGAVAAALHDLTGSGARRCRCVPQKERRTPRTPETGADAPTQRHSRKRARGPTRALFLEWRRGHETGVGGAGASVI